MPARPSRVHARAPPEVYPRLPRVEAYAALLAAETRSAKDAAAMRPVPPAPGTFETATDATAASLKAPLYDAMIDAVVAVEVARLALGDVVCAHPTPTQEAADADWSPAEARAARGKWMRCGPPPAARAKAPSMRRSPRRA